MSWVMPIFKMCWLKPGEIKQISKLHKAFKWPCRACPDLLSCELSSLYLRYTKASELHPLETHPLSNTMHWECGADLLLSCEVQLCPFAYFWSLPLTWCCPMTLCLPLSARSSTTGLFWGVLFSNPCLHHAIYISLTRGVNQVRWGLSREVASWETVSTSPLPV